MTSLRGAGIVRTGYKYDVDDPDDVLLTHSDAQRLANAIEQEILSTEGIARTGKVLEVIGTLVKVAGLDVTLGELCELRTPNGQLLQHGEVIASHAMSHLCRRSRGSPTFRARRALWDSAVR